MLEWKTMLSSSSRGALFSTPVGKKGFLDDVSESDTPSTHDGDDSEISDLTDDYREGLRLWNTTVYPSVRGTHDALHEDGQFASTPPPPLCNSPPTNRRLDRALRIHHADTHMQRNFNEDRWQRDVLDRRHSDADPSLIAASEAYQGRDYAVRRTLTTKKERRAAFDSLMDRKGSSFNSSGWRRHASAPTSPVLPPLVGCPVSDFQLDEKYDLKSELPVRPSSAPVSPMLRSLRVSNDSAPHMLLEALNSVSDSARHLREDPTRPVDTLAVGAVHNVRVQKPRHTVRFSNVQVRSYERILGDNPSCVSGPSLSLGWKYSNDDVIDATVDDYEEQREGIRSPLVPLLSRDDREAILLDLGYSKTDLACAVREANRIKNRRRQTVTNLYAAKAEEAAEGTKRWVKRTFRFGDKKKKNNAKPSKDPDSWT